MCNIDVWTILKGIVTFPPFAGLLGAALGLLLLQFLKAWWVGSHVRLAAIEHHGNFSNLRVYNGSSFSMKDAYVYISIRHKKADIMDGTAFITAQAATHVYEDRISWCINTDGKITPKADIHPFERQAATLVWFEPLAAAGPIGFASENGLHPARVFLKRQEYDLLIKIVAADTRQSSWKAKITPANVSTPVSIETVPLSVDEYEDVLRSYVEYYDS